MRKAMKPILIVDDATTNNDVSSRRLRLIVFA